MENIGSIQNFTPKFEDTVDLNKLASSSDNDNKKKIEVAKEFEAIFVRQLLSQMKDTIGDTGFGQDSGSKQIKDMFWSLLGDEMSKQGGVGLWKNIYRSMESQNSETISSIDSEA